MRKTWALGALVIGVFATGFVACSSSDDGNAPPGGAAGSGGAVDDGGPESGDEASVEAGDEASDANAEAGPTCTSYDGGASQPLATGAIYAVSNVYIDRDRARQPDPNAWKQYGFDLDGQSSDASSSNHCQLVSGADPAKVKQDGNDGIDNSFGANLAPLIASFSKTWVDDWNSGILAGGPTIVIRLPSLTLPDVDGGTSPFGPDGGPPDAGPLSDAGAPAAQPMLGYTSAKLCDAPDWLGPHLLPIDGASVTGGDLAQAKFQAPSGTLTGDYYFSGTVPEALVIIPVKQAALHLHLRNARLSMYLSADRRVATLGNIGGVASTDEVVSEVTNSKGYIYSGVCALPLLFDNIVQQIRQASDILDDGTQDPTKTCNGISMGIGFDAAIIEIGSVVDVPAPAGDGCP
jgi:hypothetical protein